MKNWKKNGKVILSVVIAFSLFFVGNNLYAADQQVMFTDLQKPVIVNQKNPVISITVKANPTTGYSWFLQRYNHNLLEVKSAKYYAPERNMPGAPGYMIWNFSVKNTAFVAPRVTKIVLLYARPWMIEQTKPVIINVMIIPAEK